MGGIGEAALAVGGALATGAETVGGALATGAETVGGALATGAETVGGYIADTASIAGDSVADFVSGMWQQGTSLDKGIGDIVSKADGVQGVVSNTPDGLVNVEKITALDGSTQYIGDIPTDINWSKTLGALTGEVGKNAVIGTLQRGKRGKYMSLVTDSPEAFLSDSLGIGKYLSAANGDLSDFLSDNSKIKQYTEMIKKLSGGIV